MLKLNKRKNLKLHTLFKYKEIVDWDVAEVCDWLNSLNLSKCYRDLFYFHEIDGNMIVDFDEDDLIALPIERPQSPKENSSRLGQLSSNRLFLFTKRLDFPKGEQESEISKKNSQRKGFDGFSNKRSFSMDCSRGSTMDAFSSSLFILINTLMLSVFTRLMERHFW